MSPRPLVYIGETTPRAWVCGACGVVRVSADDARRCCMCFGCGDVPPPRPGGRCAACETAARERRAAADRARLLAALRKAARLSPADHGGPVCEDQYGDEGTYHACLGDYLGQLDADQPPGERAPYVWACTEDRTNIDVPDMLAHIEESNACPEGYVWAYEDELRAFLDQWFARQDVVWLVDTSRVVVLDAARFEALIAEEVTRE